jgi:hypothetical protein
MLWTFMLAGGAGLLLGLWFRVPAMIAVSGLAAACLSVTLTSLDPMHALLVTVALLGGIQFGYLAGLMLAFALADLRITTLTRGERVENCDPSATSALSERREKPSLGNSC